jgi:prepilin-type processing-associated H-X9-DG protein
MGDAVGYVIGYWDTWYWNPDPTPQIYGGLRARHRAGANCLMDDGHVEYRSAEEYHPGRYDPPSWNWDS